MSTNFSTIGSAGVIPSRLERLDQLRTRLIILVIVLAVAGTCLLVSAGEGITEAGSRAWKPNSILRPITDMMTLFHQFPTRRGTEVKWLVQGLAPAALMALAAVLFFLRSRAERDEWIDADAAASPATAEPRTSRLAISPTTGAQIAMLLFSAWAVFSAAWAPWPQAARGEGTRQVLMAIWAIGIGRLLGRGGVRKAAWWMVAILGVTAVLGIWYHFERNPQERLKFPIGNPIFLAACLLPGISLGVSLVLGEWLGASRAEPAGSSGSRPQSTWARFAPLGGVLALIAMLWALHLTNSRGPQVGLVAGIVAGIYLAAAPKTRRWVLAGAGVLLLVGVLWLRGQMAVQEHSRGATIRLRLYAWQYAAQLFIEPPDIGKAIGKGQGAYLLRAQHLSRADAERDPMAFPSEMFGHAHNEWLEVLADLGAIGLALCVTSLALTAWAGAAAISRTAEPRERWALIGLLAALISLVVEECTDVALRMPGLPVVYYTVLGLVWAASSKSLQGPRTAPTRTSGVLGVGTLIGGLTAAGLALSITVTDWQGALADAAVMPLAESRRWEQALGKANLAAKHRLVIEDFISAADHIVRVAHEAAQDRARQLQQMASRAGRPGSDPVRMAGLAEEDLQAFDRYARICLATGGAFWNYIPDYPYVAGFVADIIVLRAAVQEAASEVLPGVPAAVPGDIRAAREWMEREWMRDRLEPESGLRMLQLSADQPIPERIDFLRLPLRSGPPSPQVERALAELAQEEAFGPAMNKLLQDAQLAMTAAGPEMWPDRYAPETLRMGGMIQRMTGAFERAAAMAGASAQLSTHLSRLFPSLVSYALAEQADNLLLADPENAASAVQGCLRAIEACPRADERLLMQLQRSLAMYQCAAGDEAAARQTLMSLVRERSTVESIDRDIGYTTGELVQLFMRFSPEHRPSALNGWVQRSLELVPQWPPVLLAAARIAFEQGRDAIGVLHLDTLGGAMSDAEQFAAMVRQFATSYPNSAALRSFAAARQIELSPETQPTETEPTGEPITTRPSAQPDGPSVRRPPTRPAALQSRPAANIFETR